MCAGPPHVHALRRSRWTIDQNLGTRAQRASTHDIRRHSPSPPSKRAMLCSYFPRFGQLNSKKYAHPCSRGLNTKKKSTKFSARLTSLGLVMTPQRHCPGSVPKLLVHGRMQSDYDRDRISKMEAAYTHFLVEEGRTCLYPSGFDEMLQVPLSSGHWRGMEVYAFVDTGVLIILSPGHDRMPCEGFCINMSMNISRFEKRMDITLHPLSLPPHTLQTFTHLSFTEEKTSADLRHE